MDPAWPCIYAVGTLFVHGREALDLPLVQYAYLLRKIEVPKGHLLPILDCSLVSSAGDAEVKPTPAGADGAAACYERAYTVSGRDSPRPSLGHVKSKRSLETSHGSCSKGQEI